MSGLNVAEKRTLMCKHENIRWVSGDENVDITLNGRVVAECLDCEMVAERVSDV